MRSARNWFTVLFVPPALFNRCPDHPGLTDLDGDGSFGIMGASTRSKRTIASTNSSRMWGRRSRSRSPAGFLVVDLLARQKLGIVLCSKPQSPGLRLVRPALADKDLSAISLLSAQPTPHGGGARVRLSGKVYHLSLIPIPRDSRIWTTHIRKGQHSEAPNTRATDHSRLLGRRSRP